MTVHSLIAELVGIHKNYLRNYYNIHESKFSSINNNPLNVNLSTFIKQTASNSYCSVQGQYWGATNNIEEDI